MAIPDYQTLMKPVLRSSSKGERHISDVVAELEAVFDLTGEERAELLPSGKQTTFANRVTWARSYLKKAGLVRYTKRGYAEITEDGKAVLTDDPEPLNTAYLMKFESFTGSQPYETTKKPTQIAIVTSDGRTPDEILNAAYEEINAALADELLARLQESDPAFFEDIIVRLLLKMGYGYDATAGRVIGQAGDDGVDGVINLDQLGVDQVYVQAKRYASQNTIGSGAMRDFYGALGMKDVTKGIFVTTSGFSEDARRTAEKLGARIVLVDGIQLSKLMIAHEVGCRVKRSYQIAELDESFFE